MGPKQKQKRKHNKDPLRPKRPTSAYFYFAKACRERLRAEGKSISRVSEFTKDVSVLWRKITDEEKKKHLEDAKKDKERFDAEMAVYNDTKQPKKKRACTAYFHFLAEFRKQPGVGSMHIKEISTKAGEAWRALSAEQKKPYIEKYEAERKKLAEEEAKALTAGITGGAGPSACAADANGAEDEEYEDEEDEEEEEEEEDDD